LSDALSDPDFCKRHLSKHFRYYSTKSGETMTSFDDYISRMPPEQSDIYYVIGERKEAVETSPFLEKLKKKGNEVLFLVDPVDASCFEQLKMYKGRKLVLVADLRGKVKEEQHELTGNG
jgi:molecular chaperone HtpG